MYRKSLVHTSVVGSYFQFYYCTAWLHCLENFPTAFTKRCFYEIDEKILEDMYHQVKCFYEKESTNFRSCFMV